MGQRIWIINHYATDTFNHKGGRHYSIAKYLKREGYEPVIICSNALHDEPRCAFDTQEIWHTAMADNIEVPYVFIKGRTYVGNGIHRALNICDFYINLMKSYRKIAESFGKPDYILGSSIHPLAPVAAIRLSHRMGAKGICEYRDLWPDELICMGAMRENSLPAIILRGIEHWTYRKADALVFTMEGATDYIVKRKWDTGSGGDVDLSKAVYINNGVDLEDYHHNIECYSFNDEDLDDPSTFKVIYTGTIRRANGIDKVLSIANELKDYPKIVFLLYGSGNEVDELLRIIEEKKITNVIYKGSVNKQYIPYVLSKSDLNLLHYVNGDLFRYGCSNNKLFEYLASGKPILCTIKMNYSVLGQYGCGIEVDENATVEDIAEIIKEIYYNPEKAEIYRRNALEAAKAFDFVQLSQKLISAITFISR